MEYHLSAKVNYLKGQKAYIGPSDKNFKPSDSWWCRLCLLYVQGSEKANGGDYGGVQGEEQVGQLLPGPGKAEAKQCEVDGYSFVMKRASRISSGLVAVFAEETSVRVNTRYTTATDKKVILTPHYTTYFRARGDGGNRQTL